jgi:hypothetical protein
MYPVRGGDGAKANDSKRPNKTKIFFFLSYKNPPISAVQENHGLNKISSTLRKE